jgi:hypothetical protein
MNAILRPSGDHATRRNVLSAVNGTTSIPAVARERSLSDMETASRSEACSI